MRKRGPAGRWGELQGNRLVRTGVNYKETDLYAPTLKAEEGRLLMAIAASNGYKIYKADTKQAYLYGDMGDDVVYLRPPDWWPEPIPEYSLSKAFTAQSKRLGSGTSIFRTG